MYSVVRQVASLRVRPGRAAVHPIRVQVPLIPHLRVLSRLLLRRPLIQAAPVPIRPLRPQILLRQVAARIPAVRQAILLQAAVVSQVRHRPVPAALHLRTHLHPAPIRVAHRAIPRRVAAASQAQALRQGLRLIAVRSLHPLQARLNRVPAGVRIRAVPVVQIQVQVRVQHPVVLLSQVPVRIVAQVQYGSPLRRQARLRLHRVLTRVRIAVQAVVIQVQVRVLRQAVQVVRFRELT